VRLGNPIPCPEPYTWLIRAVELRAADWNAAQRSPIATQRGAHTAPSVVREVLWEQLGWLEKQLSAGRVSIRASKTVAESGDKSPRILAYSLVGEFMTVPRLLEAAVVKLNKIEPARAAKSLQKMFGGVAKSTAIQDISVTRTDAPSSRIGVQVFFTCDREFEELVSEAADFEAKWTVTALARELLARGLSEYAPAGW
jgi:hypothetical protein